jgi:hypothetical protein
LPSGAILAQEAYDVYIFLSCLLPYRDQLYAWLPLYHNFVPYPDIAHLIPPHRSITTLLAANLYIT